MNGAYMHMQKNDYSIVIKRDGGFYTGYCLEVPQAKGQGDTRDEAIADVRKAIILCRAHIEDKRKKNKSDLVTISV